MNENIETVLKYYGKRKLGFGIDVTVFQYKHNSNQYWIYPSKPPCDGGILVTVDIGLCMSILSEMINEITND